MDTLFPILSFLVCLNLLNKSDIVNVCMTCFTSYATLVIDHCKIKYEAFLDKGIIIHLIEI